MSNATRVHLDLPAVDGTVIHRALERGIREAIGDPEAVVGWYPIGDGEDFAIVVKQAHGKWWTMMPPGFAEVIGGYFGSALLCWHDSEPPRAVDD